MAYRQRHGVGSVVRLWSGRQGQYPLNHFDDLLFVRLSVTRYRLLDLQRRVLKNRNA